MSWILPSAVLVCVALGLLSPVLYRLFGRRLGRVLAIFPAVLFTLLLTQIPSIADGEIIQAAIRWIQIPWHDGFLDIAFSFSLDGLSFLFALIITGVGTLVLMYAASYLNPSEDHAKFFAYLMLFIGAMLGVVTANNIVLLYLFWEMTSFTSFLLIGFWSHRDESRYGALKALLVTGAGGLALLAGSVLMLVLTDAVDLSVILANSGMIQENPLYPVVVVLILLGAFTKSAQVPFHLWLPNAMEAPTPVSAYLHSAAMVKAGIYLVARMSGILGDTVLWTLLVGTVGIISLVLGSYLALRQTDMKGILAYSTISQLGLIITLFGWGTPLAVTAGLFHTINHSIFKAALFMMVGIVDHQTHTRDIRFLHGLRRLMPITATIALIASLALAGIPPLNGFMSKEMFFTASLETQSILSAAPGLAKVLSYVFPTLAVLGSILTLVYSLVISYGVFFRNDPNRKLEVGARPHDPPKGLWLPPALLVTLAVAFGIAPGLVDRSVVAGASAVVLGEPSNVPLALWHGVNLPLLMSIGVIALGVLIYSQVDKVRGLVNRLPNKPNVNALYDWAVDALVRFGEFIESRLMTGFSRDYFAYILGFFLTVFGLTLLNIGAFPMRTDVTINDGLDWAELLFGLIVAVAAVSVPFFRSRAASILALGAVGTGLIMLWTLFRAPDLSLTMLVVELVSLLLFLLVFAYLPKLRREVFPRFSRSMNWIFAGASGLIVTLLMLGVRGIRTTSPVADWYLAHSLEAAHGRNVVNVILVDFRGFDTLFEITVLALAGIGVYILSNLRYRGGSD